MKVSLEKMLLATDASPCSRKIASWAPELKKAGVTEVGILFVININKISSVGSGIDIEKYIQEESKCAEEILPEIAEVFKKEEIRVRIIEPFPAGDPVVEIVRHSADYDFIGMGSRGRSLFKEILLGSVSEGVLRRSRIPVMIFKFRMEEKEEGIECIGARNELFSKLLVAYDFSSHSQKALAYAKYVSERTGGKIYLLHVRENDETVVGDIEEILGEIRRNMEVEEIVRTGSPAKIILRTAEEIGATAIFMGSRGVGTLWSLFLGSTSDTVVRRSDVPVFVCKAEELEVRS